MTAQMHVLGQSFPVAYQGDVQGGVENFIYNMEDMARVALLEDYEQWRATGLRDADTVLMQSVKRFPYQESTKLCFELAFEAYRYYGKKCIREMME